ncbi:tRNA-splicing endonuclease subunit Sen54-like [Saccostrea echinata]|uniref:tRNA-splicing endonuclease subunit Sen54-like n=1 Tax=Saccostrea echinata TaxID=191078 RepID=UPI002A804711|nr:tRNA-splicing endonuclease subunit Sen54-like [Saccostrea echinata]
MESRENKQEQNTGPILCYDKVLCDEELFKHRKPTDKTVPQRGGDKDFSPDDSWLQAKRLEKFYEERRAVLAEPRVERVGSLVTGEWNPQLQLVELHKEMGKFWSCMGFSDKSRKWLYPEEALFLMETNTLEVWYKGLPVSIQQAYTEFLKNFKFEEYLVYAHLRRIGYVVLRHQGRLLSTKYERKIKLDKHINLKKRRNAQVTSVKDEESADTPQKKVRVSDNEEFSENSKVQTLEIPSTCVHMEDHMSDSKSNNLENKHIDTKGRHDDLTVSVKENDKINFETTGVGQVQHNFEESLGYNRKDVNTGGKDEECKATRYSVWNFEEIKFPDISDIDNFANLQLKDIPQRFLPEGIPPLSRLKVNAEQFVKQKKQSQKFLNSKGKFGQELDYFDLNFSCDVVQPVKKVSASNWREYKEKMLESMKGENFISPVEHLWKDEVTPLVRPEDAQNTIAVLEKLKVIQTWDGNSVSTRNTEANQDLPRVSYDVYKPDAKFRKSNPGIPDHRICVVGSEEDPPSLSTLMSFYGYFDDEVPLHWAVADEGEIAFYSFGQISLPTQVFMG